jgi:hypothetical protein
MARQVATECALFYSYFEPLLQMHVPDARPVIEVDGLVVLEPGDLCGPVVSGPDDAAQLDLGPGFVKLSWHRTEVGVHYLDQGV